MIEYNMTCPVCRSKLIRIGKGRLETLFEHVSNPNGLSSVKYKMGCSNRNCPTVGVVFWDCWGDLYIDDYSKYADLKSKSLYIDDNHSPFNSFGRKMNTEQTHKFEKVLFETKNRVFEVIYNIKSDYDGNIISKHPYIRILKKDIRDGSLIYGKAIPLTIAGWFKKIRARLLLKVIGGKHE